MEQSTAKPTPRKLEWYEQAAAGLPLILLFVGGAIGGACGGLGYGINATIFRTDLPTPAKYALSLLVSGGAAMLYVMLVGLLMYQFPALRR